MATKEKWRKDIISIHDLPVSLRVVYAAYDEIFASGSTSFLQSLSQLSKCHLLCIRVSALRKNLNHKQHITTLEAKIRVFANEISFIVLSDYLSAFQISVGSEILRVYMCIDDIILPDSDRVVVQQNAQA